MGFYNIYVSNEAHIYVKNRQLFLKNKDNCIDFPLEDINCVLIESVNTTISSYTLSKIAEYGISTFICNESHLPCGIVLPFCEHFQTLYQYKFQINMSKPLGKQLWATIIKNKIENQNEVLNICGGNDSLIELKKSVLSGDSTNNEAKASLIYFKELFGKDFSRRSDNSINSFLNYGYSIIRGFVARSITVHGLLPFLGIFHCSGLNQFNLADDLMEIFRPIVDLYVKIYLCDKVEMTTEVKGQLLNLMNYDVLVDGERQIISYSIELLVQSFIKSLKAKKDCLKNIKIFGLELHHYE